MEKLPLVEKVLSVLLNAQIINIDLMKRSLPDGIDEDKIIAALQEVSYCIRGIWILFRYDAFFE